MNIKRTLLLIAGLLVAGLIAAAAAPGSVREPLPTINPPTILPAVDALYGKDTEWMRLGFIEIDREGNVRIWGYLQGPISRATPVVLFTQGGRWMAAVYDTSPDLAQTGFWYVGRDSSGYVAVIDCEIEGAFPELILARSSDGIRWRPVGVLKKENYSQLFQELQIFDGGRWEISISARDDVSDGLDYVYESTDSGRSWRFARREAHAPLFNGLSRLLFGRGDCLPPMVKVEGEIRNPRYAPASE